MKRMKLLHYVTRSGKKPLDPTRINRAERSTSNLQVNRLLFCNVL